MIEIHARFDVSPPGRSVVAKDRLQLPFDERQKSRLRARLVSGEEVALALPRGEVLRGGDLLLATDGRVVEVVARPEQLLHVECDSPQALARAAYHLGNRHVAIQLGAGWLRIAADHVLARMLEGLGLKVKELEAPFEPEPGAYGGHAHHDDAPPTHGGIIHRFGEPAVHDHARHDHDHCDHDHHDHGTHKH